MALKKGWISVTAVDRARVEQRSLADRGVARGLFLILQDQELISETQAAELRKHTSSASLRALEVEGYIFQGRIGSGGMGDVFRGRNAAGNEVAIKLLAQKYAANVENLARFVREAKAGERLHHGHITRSLGHGEVGGTRYLMMELVPGPSLKARITEAGKLDEEAALCVLAQISSALNYAWKHGVLHRDVKPANIILAPPRPGRSEPFCAKLCDFGLAKVLTPGDGSGSHASIGQLTGEGLALGTPHYMSPEQASGEMDLDQRADIYGLGATLYHGLLGHTMYTGKSSAVIMYKQVTETVDLTQLTPAVASPGFRALLERMLTKDRAKRPAQWDEITDEAERLKAKRQSQRLPAIGPSPSTSAAARRVHPSIAAASGEIAAPPLSSPATPGPVVTAERENPVVPASAVTPAPSWWRALANRFTRGSR